MTSCGTCVTNPCGAVQILQGYEKTYFIDLFYEGSEAAFDLTGCTEIIVAFPPATGSDPIEVSKTDAEVTVIGAPGAGRIQVKITAAKSALIRINPAPDQFQDSQVAVTNADTSVSGFLLSNSLNVVLPTLGVV